MHQTIGLLRAIGSPFVSGTQCPKDHEIQELYYCSLRNRIPLLYLLALKDWDMLGGLKKTYDVMYEKSCLTYDAISRVSRVLTEANVNYTLFKTIRPYTSTTVDIDILVFKSDDEYRKSMKAIAQAGYKKLGSGPNSMTFKDPHIDMGIDLYRQIAVSQIVYLDKDKIDSSATKKIMLPNNLPTQTMFPSADIIALIAHSVIKEHMYTISEYYSTLYFLADMNADELTDLIEMIYENAIVNVARVHIGLSAKLHEAAHGFVPEKIEKIIEKIGINSLETWRLVKNLETPHKFHPLTLARAILEKTKEEEKTRRSIAKQITNMLNPSFSRIVTGQVVDHIRRQTY